MKKLFFALFVAAGLFACGENAAKMENSATTGGTTNTTEGKSLDDMPGPIRTSFQNRYSGAVLEKWERETENNQEMYEVEFKLNNVDKKAYFDATGNFLREEND